MRATAPTTVRRIRTSTPGTPSRSTHSQASESLESWRAISSKYERGNCGGTRDHDGPRAPAGHAAHAQESHDQGGTPAPARGEAEVERRLPTRRRLEEAEQEVRLRQVVRDLAELTQARSPVAQAPVLGRGAHAGGDRSGRRATEGREAVGPRQRDGRARVHDPARDPALHHQVAAREEPRLLAARRAAGLHREIDRGLVLRSGHPRRYSLSAVKPPGALSSKRGRPSSGIGSQGAAYATNWRQPGRTPGSPSKAPRRTLIWEGSAGLRLKRLEPHSPQKSFSKPPAGRYERTDSSPSSSLRAAPSIRACAEAALPVLRRHREQ